MDHSGKSGEFIPRPVNPPKLGQLVLSRRVGQRIFLDGGRIIVTVIQADRGKARLGILAPPDVAIDREEIHLSKLEGGR